MLNTENRPLPDEDAVAGSSHTSVNRHGALRTIRCAARAHRRHVAVKLPLRPLMTIVCAAGLTIAVSGCGARAGGGDPLAFVLKRAAAADSSFGVRYSFRSRLTDDEGTHRFHGYGQAEADQRRVRTVVVDRNMRFETIVDGNDEYSGGSLAIAELLLNSPSRNVRWTKLDRSRLLDAGSIDKLCGPELPTKIASVLASSDPTIEKLGAAHVGGLRAWRYRVTTTYGRVLDTLAGDEDTSQCDEHDRAARFAAELWIDRHNLVRRVRLRYRLVDGSIVETSDITSYDHAVRVTVPSGPTVGDVTDAMLKVVHGIQHACKSSTDC
jgi:hypothetical protein